MYISEVISILKKENRGSDQYSIAKMLGVSQATISNYTQKKSYPTLEIAAKVYKDYDYRVEPFTELAIETYIEKYMR